MAARGDIAARHLDRYTKPPHQKSGEKIKIKCIFFHTHYISLLQLHPLHVDGHPPVTKSKERLSIGFNRILFSLLNTLRGSGPCNGSSNGGGVERRTAPASAKKERKEAGIVRLEQNMKSKNSFFSLFFDFQSSHTPLLDFLIARRALLSSPL